MADKAARVEHFQGATVRGATQIMASMGVGDPAELRPAMLRRRMNLTQIRGYDDLYHWLSPGGLLTDPQPGWAHWSATSPDRFGG